MHARKLRFEVLCYVYQIFRKLLMRIISLPFYSLLYESFNGFQTQDNSIQKLSKFLSRFYTRSNQLPFYSPFRAFVNLKLSYIANIKRAEFHLRIWNFYYNNITTIVTFYSILLKLQCCINLKLNSRRVFYGFSFVTICKFSSVFSSVRREAY